MKNIKTIYSLSTLLFCFIIMSFESNGQLFSTITIDANDANGLIMERNNNIYTDTKARLGISSNGGIPGFRMAISSNNGASYVDGVFIREGGNVGINQTLPSQKLHVSGNVLANSYLINSDLRYKKNIKPIGGHMERLSLLRGVSYNLNQTTLKGVDNDKNPHIGFIAQEVREVYPELVHESAEGYLSVDYVSLIPILVEALKENSSIIAQQTARINGLEEVLKNNNLSLLEESKSNVQLAQNVPNPFNSETKISYRLPEGVTHGAVMIYNLKGQQIKKYEINHAGSGSITIQSGELEAGIYTYGLLIDGQGIATKKMILTK